MSNFQQDLNKESILAEFLDSKYKGLGWITNRIYDKETQKLGVDVIIKKEKLGKRIDEKAQLHYINESLPTFALEISYFIGKNIKQGWLFDANKWTDLYAFVFNIQVNNQEKKLERVEDLILCEVVFVRRITLLNELAKLNLNLKTCEEISLTLRDGTETKHQHQSGFNFHISRQLSECPVNLIVTRTFLEHLAVCKYTFNT